MRTLSIALLTFAVAAAMLYVVRSHHAPLAKSTRTTSSTISVSTTTTLAWPASFVTSAVTGQGAQYLIPADKYEVTVLGSAGPVWVVYRMGPQQTLEFQGRLSLGQSKTLQMTGSSQVTLGSPQNATVNVGGSPVTFPSPPATPLTLVFTPSPTAGG